MPGLCAITAVHAAGHGVAALWQAVEQGRSGLRHAPLDWCDLPCWIGTVPGVEDLRLPASLQSWDCRNHRLAWLALDDQAFRRAVRAACVRYGSQRVGILLGTSTSGIRSTEIAYSKRLADGRWPPGFDYRRTHSADAIVRFCALLLEVDGPMAVLSTACSSSAKVFVTARRWIDAGLIDAAIVGGVDSLCLSTLHGFNALQLVSDQVCRPFDVARKGISIGEAAGFALLTREPAPIHLSGGGESSDAWHMSTPHPQGEGAQRAMRAALSSAGLEASDIGYVNAHGTATVSNDRSEGAALSAVFGERAVPVSSTKGVTGHTLGAAGIVEAIVAVLALEHQSLPPTANLIEPDPGISVDVVRQARSARLRHVMSNSFGFGGSNCALVFSSAG